MTVLFSTFLLSVFAVLWVAAIHFSRNADKYTKGMPEHVRKHMSRYTLL